MAAFESSFLGKTETVFGQYTPLHRDAHHPDARHSGVRL